MSESLKTYKVIELEDHYVDHSGDYPYVQSQQTDKRVMFTLRSRKTYRHQPILLLDRYEKDKLVLPLIVGSSVVDLDNCEFLLGFFSEDGCWYCEYEIKSPGLLHFQLVFVDYGGTVIRDLGSFDCILQVQNQVDLRKLRKQTIFPRCIGKVEQWGQYLDRQVGLGYNAFHFAPVQQTGYSKSYYSIFDQLQLASDIFSGSSEQRYKQLEGQLSEFQKKGVIFFIDIVLNHTSFDSDWIKKDTSAIFTTKNTPMLTAAFELDHALRQWGKTVKQSFGATSVDMTTPHFEQIRGQLTQLVHGLKLYQFFQFDQKLGEQFISSLAPSPPSENIFAKDPSELVLEFIQLHCAGLGVSRNGVHIDNLGTKWRKTGYAYECNDVHLGIRKFNNKWKKTIKNQWQQQIINNLLGQISYNYLQAKNRRYDDELPFINPYFSYVDTISEGVVPALNNGWVMSANTNENLVTTKNFYYLRRKVSVWGDLIRIRYGESPEQSIAWEHMRKYVQTMARIFNGFRLDNLHGTQLNVAQWMIKEARKVKPEIIIFAELFTTTEREKAVFVRTSGVNSTLFELAHHASGSQFMYLFHESMSNQGKYMGSISPHFDRPDGTRVKYCKRKKPVPLIYDLTHDNRTYEDNGQIIKKTPICMIIQFCGAFVASTKGFDQFYSHKIIVTETGALYKKDTEKAVGHGEQAGIKKLIFSSSDPKQKVQLFGNWNNWSKGTSMQYSGKLGYETGIDLPAGTYEYKFKVNGEWVCDNQRQINSKGNHQFQSSGPVATRTHHNLEQLRRCGAETRDKYYEYNEYFAYNDNDIVVLIREKKTTRESIVIIVNLSTQAQKFQGAVKLPGVIRSADVWVQQPYSKNEGFTTDVQIVNHDNLHMYFDVFFHAAEQKDYLLANTLPAGFACIIECNKTEAVVQALRNARQLKDCQITLPPLGPLDYNLIMFGVEPEEQARFNSTTFYLPADKRKLIFGGFGGIIAELQRAKRENILSGGLFDSIREGDWLLDYYISRLRRFPHLSEFTQIVQKYFQYFKRVPSYLKPKYFTSFIYKIYKLLQEQISKGSKNRLQRKLLLASTQFISSFDTQNPLFRVTLSAGLPHFSTGWTRCWGRDTFMSNQLLLLYPEVYKGSILQFASVLRHGMIPNLLDFGKNPRYNCRDASWWFIRGVKQYIRATGDYKLLKTKVDMVFLSNDLLEHRQKQRNGQTRTMLLQQIVQCIFQSHADGITYREWNAGYEIDSNMSTDGFTIKLAVDEDTGFVVGGNSYNCLTWMDKMGSSGRAGNKGYPATPRAGAPVQMTALLYHCCVQFDKLHKEGHYSFAGVKFEKIDITFEYWAKRIHDNFQTHYFIDEKSDKTKYQHIYKDVVFPPSVLYYEEFRLRPNALVALALAPELCDPEHARQYLQVVEKQLIQEYSIGVGTLGELHESLYVPYYDNQDDSADIKTAQGFSYHNGPEWVWLYGFYIKAKCNFTPNLHRYQLTALLQHHARYLYSNDWGSLPELTNRNGATNWFSCQSQAWSISSIIMAVNAIKQYEVKK